jgi:hypothetical protein
MTPGKPSQRPWRFAFCAGEAVDSLLEGWLGPGELNLKSPVFNLQFAIPLLLWLQLRRGEDIAPHVLRMTKG